MVMLNWTLLFNTTFNRTCTKILRSSATPSSLVQSCWHDQTVTKSAGFIIFLTISFYESMLPVNQKIVDYALLVVMLCFLVSCIHFNLLCPSPLVRDFCSPVKLFVAERLCQMLREHFTPFLFILHGKDLFHLIRLLQRIIILDFSKIVN